MVFSQLLTALLSLPGLKCPGQSIYLQALTIYAQNSIDFPDCLTVAHMLHEDMRTLYSYDRDFDRFGMIKRCEPEPS